MSRHLPLGAAALAAAAGHALLLLTPARLTVHNDGFLVEYGWAAPVGAALAAVGAIGLATLLRPLAAKVFAAIFALAMVVLGVQRGAWQIGADRTAITSRTLTEEVRFAWSEIRQVQSDADALQVIGFGDDTRRIQVSGLRAHDQATLERTISRRVQETVAAPAPRSEAR